MDVIIKYVGPVVEDFVREGYPICDIFYPTGSYVNTPPYTEGVYVLLESEPADWSTAYTKYFTKSGTTYVPVAASEGEAPVWAGDTYYLGTGKSVYANNVDGRGYLEGLRPLANTTTPFAYFERAIIIANEAAASGGTNNGVTITIADDDYKARIYWEQMCANLVDNGFYSKVGSTEFGVDPTAAA